MITAPLADVFIVCSDKSQDVFGVWSTGAFGCVLLADISGFTKLANSLDVESLKFHIK